MPSKLKQTAFRLTEKDLAIIDGVRKRVGLATRTEALRYLLRWSEGTLSLKTKKRG